jgi:tripartite-type tricarboxylate transporter receptor subunit TctC
LTTCTETTYFEITINPDGTYAFTLVTAAPEITVDSGELLSGISGGSQLPSFTFPASTFDGAFELVLTGTNGGNPGTITISNTELGINGNTVQNGEVLKLDVVQQPGFENTTLESLSLQIAATGNLSNGDELRVTIVRVGGSSSFATGPALRKTPPYDAARDFVPLAMVGYVPFVLVVTPTLPVHSVPDLIKLAKAKPGELSYGSGGPGHTAHIYAELLKRMTGIQMAHVPYKGSPPALNDIVGGHIQLMFGDALPSLPLIAEGKVRALAVSSSMRLPSAPDIPTMVEAGVPGFDAAAWIMVVAPVKTPPEIVGKLRSELIPILAAPDVQSWITKNGMIPAKSQIPEDLQRFMSSEQARWRGVLEEIGIAGSQ